MGVELVVELTCRSAGEKLASSEKSVGRGVSRRRGGRGREARGGGRRRRRRDAGHEARRGWCGRGERARHRV